MAVLPGRRPGTPLRGCVSIQKKQRVSIARVFMPIMVHGSITGLLDDRDAVRFDWLGRNQRLAVRALEMNLSVLPG